MTMKWFGRKYDAPVYDDCPRIDTPVGELCIHCGDTITAEDDGIEYASGQDSHRPCFLRVIFGSVAHLQKRCSCYVPGSTENDDEGLSKREAAQRVTELLDRKARGGGNAPTVPEL